LLAATALDWPDRESRRAPFPRSDYAFFDQRFGKARRIADSWPASIGPIAVLGDVTPWSSMLARASRARELQLCGVTTESFRFCAGILAGDRASVQSQVSRLDGDLVLWTMRTTPREIRNA
jgi:hypothetical protein